MTLNISPLQESVNTDSAPDISADVTPNVFLGTKPVLKNWKMFGAVPQEESSTDNSTDNSTGETDLSEINNESVHAPLVAAPRNVADRSIRSIRPAAPYWLQIGQAVAVFVTVAWISYASIYILALPNSIKTITSSPLTLGGILASVLAPVAMLWLCLATWQRRSDAHIYAEALREELRGLFYPDADQSNLVSEEIRDLMKQATEMSATSRGAIKAIQRARTGLRAEIRDFAGVSQKAEFHIDRLADSLSKRATELLSLTETIELQTENISAKAQRGIGQWENISAEISELGEEVEQLFVSGADTLKTATDTALERVATIETSLGASVDSLTTKIDSIAVQFDGTHAQLDGQINRLDAVSESINGGANRLEESLSDAENIYGAVEGMMKVMSESLNKVEATAEDFYAKTTDIEEKLETRAGALKDSADQLLSSTESLQEVGDSATHKLGEALALALSGAETITSAVRRSKDMMDKAVMDASTQMEQTSKVADEKLAALIEEARNSREQLTQLIADIEARQSQLSAVSQKIDDSRVELSGVVDKASSSLNDAATQMVAQSEKPLTLIRASIDAMENQTQSLESVLAARNLEIQQETGKLQSLVSSIDDVMKDNIVQLTTATALVSEQSKDMKGEIAEQLQSLDGFMQALGSKSDAMMSSLEKRRDTIETSILSTDDSLSVFGSSFFEKSDKLLDKANFVSGQMADYETLLSSSVSALQQKYEDISESVEEQVGRMTALSSSIAPEADRMIAKAEEVYARYDALKEKCFSMTDETTENLSGLHEKLESSIAGLGQSAVKTSQSLLESTDDMAAAMMTVKNAAAEAQDKINHVQSALDDRVTEFETIGTRVQNNVDKMQDNLGNFAKDLNEVLHLSVSDLDVATAKFAETTSWLDEKTNGVTTRIVDATRLYVEEGHRMSLLSEQTVHKAARIVSAIKQESDKLINASKASLLDLQKSGDTLSVRAKEIEEYLKASTQHTRNYTDALKQQVSLVADHTNEIVDSISGATLKISNKADALKQSGQNVIEDIEAAGVRLEEGASILGRVARVTIGAVDDAVTRFADRGQVLQNTVNDLSAQIKNVQTVQVKTERETFLSSAKFVIESLYSLALDVSRHLEGDLDARTLKTYQKGDVSAYVRHLVEMAPRMPVDKSQRKFIEDGEFRTYVLRFIRQYEELLEQAQANDYGDLLSSVFSTSDIGKLYKILCEISGRSSKEH